MSAIDGLKRSTRALDLTGQRFGALVAVALGPKAGTGQNRWRCSCDCGGESLVVASMLKQGRTTRCRDCGNRAMAAANTNHGHSTNGATSITYQTWRAMLARCSNENIPAFDRYGGRGISVCPRWLSFEAFAKDMGVRPPSTSLDRINNDGNYEPGNCRWATSAEQNRNRSSSKLAQEDVDAIRVLLNAGQARRDIADRFRVSESMIGTIARGETWK